MTHAATAEPERKVIKVYVLAAPEDQVICATIQKFLAPAVKASRVPIELNDDFNIPAGADREEHKRQLFDADIVLVLISSDFLDDDEINTRQDRVIARHNADQTVMVPILVRNCMWKLTPFPKLGLLPRRGKPLNNKDEWNSLDDAVAEVVEEIYGSISRLTLAEDGQPSPAGAVETAPPPAPAAEGRAPPAPKRPTWGFTDEARAVSNVDVDWRRKYYKGVLWRRLGAIVLDHVAVLGVVVVLIIVDTILYPDDEVGSWVVWAFYGFYFVAMPLMESSRWRGTVGKRLLNLEITNKEGQRISFLRAFVRNLFRSVVLYSYLFVVPAIIQYFRFGKVRKLFHDEFSGTVIGQRVAGPAATGAVAPAR